jgi:hypothetical protein
MGLKRLDFFGLMFSDNTEVTGTRQRIRCTDSLAIFNLYDTNIILEEK